MGKETISELNENGLRHKYDQTNILLEYENLTSNLKEELYNCKSEQRKLRLEIDELRSANQNASDEIRQSWTEYHNSSYGPIDTNKELITNLEKRVTIMQMEKDSVFQLWQMALKAIDVLEHELKTVHKEDISTRHCQEQINNIKESYSEAIKVLELKLAGAKEHFFQQQAIEKNNKEKIDSLINEKMSLIEHIRESQDKIIEKEKLHESTLQSLKEALEFTKTELNEFKQLKIDLEKKLSDSQNFVAAMISHDAEAKTKISEAVNLVESVVKEKDIILERETKLSEEKNKLENYLRILSNNFSVRLETEIHKTKESYNKNMKKYLGEIKGLRSDLREKITLLDRVQREKRLIEEEMEKMRNSSNNLNQHTNLKFLDIDKLLDDKENKFYKFGKHRNIYDDKIQFLEHQIMSLEDKLSLTSDKLKRSQIQNLRDIENQVRETDEHTKEVMEKCSTVERRLAQNRIDKETLSSNLQTLQASFEREVQKRSYEKLILENKVQHLESNIKKTGEILDNSRILSIDPLSSKNVDQRSINMDIHSSILALQEKYDKKTKELTHYVEVHQQMSNKWREEANSLTSKFQKRTKDLRSKISALQYQNEELTRELNFYQKHFTQYNAQLIKNNSNNETENNR